MKSISVYTVSLWLLLFSFLPAIAQSSSDSIRAGERYSLTKGGNQLKINQLIIPGTLIATGVVLALEEDFDRNIRDEVVKHEWKTGMDNILPAVAPLSVYVLNWCGERGKHNFIDRSVILGTSSVITLGSVFILKQTTSRKRPDGSNEYSFPSMHTAAAFMGAEFLYQEYKDKSVWYGVAGYGLAMCTGMLRVYNNKHWFSDVLVGAGIGIVGTKLAYWIYPEIRKLYAGSFLDQAMVLPCLSPNNLGVVFSARF